MYEECISACESRKLEHLGEDAHIETGGVESLVYANGYNGQESQHSG